MQFESRFLVSLAIFSPAEVAKSYFHLTSWRASSRSPLQLHALDKQNQVHTEYIQVGNQQRVFEYQESRKGYRCEVEMICSLQNNIVSD